MQTDVLAMRPRSASSRPVREATTVEYRVRRTPVRDDLADREAIARIADARDAAALEALYRHYREPLGAFLSRMLPEPLAVAEVYNEVMWTVWRRACTYNGASKVSTWLYAIAYRQALSALRRNRPRPMHAVPADEAPAPAPPDLADEELVRQALARLAPDHRLVIELTYFAGLKYEEIAQVADCPLNTVKSRMFHARRKLKVVLAELGESTMASTNDH